MVPIEKLRTQFFLKLLDGARQKQLFDMQALCSPGEMQFLRQGYKKVQVPQFHLCSRNERLLPSNHCKCAQALQINVASIELDIEVS